MQFKGLQELDFKTECLSLFLFYYYTSFEVQGQSREQEKSLRNGDSDLAGYYFIYI